MGGCMSWQRMLRRNSIHGDYGDDARWQSLMSGELKRIATDQRDMRHLERYSRAAGCDVAQVKIILDLFFDYDCEGQDPDGLFKYNQEQ